MTTPFSSPRRRNFICALLTFVTIVAITSAVRAAYISSRPLVSPDGKILQSYYLTATPPAPPGIQVWYPYLYGDEAHRGADFPAVLGTNIYAVEGGTVVDLRESIDNSTGLDWGNYVLIRHPIQHYIRQNNGVTVDQMGYVYALYAHLSKNSVNPNIGDTVIAGQVIAQVDDTGNSTGDHLHFQMVLHQTSNLTVASGVNPKSRNAELWLPPFNSGTRATAIGKVTNQAGTAQGGLRICGVQKPTADVLNPWLYAQTYDQTDENPDDILVENFGTTDVLPGTYHLYARSAPSDQINPCSGALYKDLGNYTFAAGQTTYIGLYPTYLPFIKANSSNWDTSVVLRTNNTADTASIITTFFSATNAVDEQRTDSKAPQTYFSFDPTGIFEYGSAIVVGSQDASVAALRRRSTVPPYSRSAIIGITSTQTSSTFNIPLVMRNFSPPSDLMRKFCNELGQACC